MLGAAQDCTLFADDHAGLDGASSTETTFSRHFDRLNIDRRLGVSALLDEWWGVRANLLETSRVLYCVQTNWSTNPERLVLIYTIECNVSLIFALSATQFARCASQSQCHAKRHANRETKCWHDRVGLDYLGTFWSWKLASSWFRNEIYIVNHCANAFLFCIFKWWKLFQEMRCRVKILVLVYIVYFQLLSNDWIKFIYYIHCLVFRIPSS